MMKMRTAKILAVAAAATVACSACTASGGGTEPATTERTEQANSADPGDLFSDRDLDGSYDKDAATKITLSGNRISVSGDGAETAGQTVTIAKEGVYLLTGTLWGGQIVIDADDEKVQLVLAGAEITSTESACIYIKKADKVFLTLADGTDNVLSDSGAAYTQKDPDVTVDGVIFSRDDLTVNGNGTLTVNAGYSHGIVSRDDLKITGGTIVVDAAAHGLAGKDSVRVAGGSITVTAGKDAIHTSNNEDDDRGFVAILDGTLILNAGDDGIHAEQSLTIAGGTVDVRESYEGFEGKTVDIAGGDVRVTSEDDGINAAYDEESDDSEETGHDDFGGRNDAQEACYIRVSDGSLRVNAGGDGLDSNGYLYVDGGTIVVDGPENDRNGALDCGLDAVITGGTLVAAGSAGKAVNFGSASTQVSLLVFLESTHEGGTTVTLADETGTEVMSATPAKRFRSVVFSSTALSTGTYTIHASDETLEAEITGVSATVGTSGFEGFRGGPGK